MPVIDKARYAIDPVIVLSNDIVALRQRVRDLESLVRRFTEEADRRHDSNLERWGSLYYDLEHAEIPVKKTMP